jgi:transglutaminase-like putative cysteine protease
MFDLRKAIPIVMLLSVLSASVATSAGLPELKDIDLNTLAGDGWFRATLMGKPVGYLHSEAVVTDADGQPGLRSVETMALKFDFGNGAMEVQATTVTEYGSDLKPRTYRVVQDEFGRPKTVDALVKDGALEVTTLSGDARTTKTLKTAPNFGSELAFGIAMAQGLVREDTEFDFQGFVPELELLVDFHVKCTGREKLTVFGEEVDALKVSFAAPSLGLEMKWWLGPGADLVRQEVPGLMGLVLERVTEEEALKVAAPMVISDHIAVETRMGETRRLTYVRLKATSLGTPADELVPEMPLQHVTRKGERDAEVEVKAETDAGLSGVKLPIQRADLQEYLAPNATVQCDDPALRAKAKEIVGDETDAWLAAQKLVRWVHGNMAKVDHDPRPCTATECLAMMKGDCSEHATLLTALARAVGIPSRFVTGIVYLNDGYYYHAWNELYINRWVSVDPTWGEYTVDAGHLALASGSLTPESFAKTNLSAVRCMGALGLEVIDHRSN